MFRVRFGVVLERKIEIDGQLLVDYVLIVGHDEACHYVPAASGLMEYQFVPILKQKTCMIKYSSLATINLKNVFINDQRFHIL